MNFTVAASIFIAYGTGIVLYFIFNRKKGGRIYRIAYVNCIICYGLCLLALTQLPHKGRSGFNLVPFVNFLKKTETGRIFDFAHFLEYIGGAALNILLFVPFGIFAGVFCRLNYIRRPVLKAFLFAAALSAALELLQLVLPAGRFADIDDVIFNALGGALGAWVFFKIKNKPILNRFLKMMRLSSDVDEIYS